MKTLNCLIVDDEPDLLATLSIDLERNMKISCHSAASLADAKQALSQQHYDLCITDMALVPPRGREGLELIQYIQANYPQIQTIIITAHGDMDSAIQAFRSGAFDYITKPLDFKALHNVIKNAFSMFSPALQTNAPQLIGQSKVMLELRNQVAKVARGEAPVHISGESGSGKELVARAIHHQSNRCNKPFVAVNCGAIPENLVESELFGHKKGSFTGAHADRHGLFEEAKGGTLFLDEISELPLNMQVKLLRALQEKMIRPVGANKEIPTNVRIVSATHQNLLDLVNQGEFREDLYFRIRVFELHAPALRERADDIKLLAQHILQRLCSQKKYTLTAKAISSLEAYPFRGNVRELENMLEAAITLCTGNTIKPKDLNLGDYALPKRSRTDTSAEPVITKEAFEREQMLSALNKTKWNKKQASNLLDMSWGKFRFRFDKYALDKENPFKI